MERTPLTRGGSQIWYCLNYWKLQTNNSELDEAHDYLLVFITQIFRFVVKEKEDSFIRSDIVGEERSITI